MIDKKHDQLLEEYLQGKSGISRHYQSEATQQPAKHVDDAILAAARKSAGSKPHVLHKIYKSDWYKPVSWAAVLVICVSLVFNIYQDSDQELFTAPTPDLILDKPAPTRDDSGLESKKDAGGKPRTESIPGSVKKNKEINAASPEDIKMIWQREGNQSEDTEVSKPQAAAPAMSEQIMQDKVMRKEEFEAQVEQRDEKKSADDAGITIMQETESERSSIHSRQAEMDLSEMRMTDEPVTVEMTPEQWLEHISQLWNQGNREQAIDSLKQFIDAHPEYTAENMKSKLPEGLNLSDYLH